MSALTAFSLLYAPLLLAAWVWWVIRHPRPDPWRTCTPKSNVQRVCDWIDRKARYDAAQRKRKYLQAQHVAEILDVRASRALRPHSLPADHPLPRLPLRGDRPAISFNGRNPC